MPQRVSSASSVFRLSRERTIFKRSQATLQRLRIHLREEQRCLFFWRPRKWRVYLTQPPKLLNCRAIIDEREQQPTFVQLSALVIPTRPPHQLSRVMSPCPIQCCAQYATCTCWFDRLITAIRCTLANRVSAYNSADYAILQDVLFVSFARENSRSHILSPKKN